MQIHKQKNVGYRRQGGIAIALFLFVSMGMGCASTHKKTTTETTVTTETYPNKGVIYQGEQQTTKTVVTSSDQQNNDVVEKSEATTTTTETEAEHPGVLSSTLHAVGYVISLPFIIIGGVFRMIFGG